MFTHTSEHSSIIPLHQLPSVNNKSSVIITEITPANKDFNTITSGVQEDTLP